MIAQSLEEIDALIDTAIRAITPRRQRQGDHGWTPYDAARQGSHFTRAYRLDWIPGEYQQGGIFTPAAVETTAILIVRTDYRDDTDQLAFIVEDDKHQLRDVLNDLMQPDNGLLWAEELSTEDEASDEQGGVVILHRFEIRYLRSRAQ